MFETSDVGLFSSHQAGKLLLSQSSLGAGIIDQLCYLGIDRFLLDQLSQSLILTCQAVENLQRILRLTHR